MSKVYSTKKKDIKNTRAIVRRFSLKVNGRRFKIGTLIVNENQLTLITFALKSGKRCVRYLLIEIIYLRTLRLKNNQASTFSPGIKISCVKFYRQTNVINWSSNKAYSSFLELVNIKIIIYITFCVLICNFFRNFQRAEESLEKN